MCGLASRDIHPQKDGGKSVRSTLQAGPGSRGLGLVLLAGALASLSFTSVLISTLQHEDLILPEVSDFKR